MKKRQMDENYYGLRLDLGLRCSGSSNLPSTSLNLNQSGSMLTRPTLESHSTIGVQTSIVISSEIENETIASHDGFDLNQPMVTTESDNVVVIPANNVALNDGRDIKEHKENDEGSNKAKKKMRFSVEQVALLEDIFEEHNIPDQKQKLDLAEVLNVTPRQVEVWFQNRRVRLRMKQNETEFGRLKILYDTLKKENEVLKKEIDDLRSQNISGDDVTIFPSLSSTSTLSTLNLLNNGIKYGEQDIATASTSKRSKRS